MSSALRLAARKRLVVKARALLKRIPACPEAVIPVSLTGWSSALSDARLRERYESLVTSTVRLRELANGDAPAEFEREVEEMAAAVALFAEDLACLAALKPAASARVQPLRDRLVALGAAVLEQAACGAGDDSTAPRLETPIIGLSTFYTP
jgi:hypothetical protein